MKIRIHKQYNPKREERVSCFISKENSEQLDKLCDETGISKQRLTDMLLKKAIESVEIVECDI